MLSLFTLKINGTKPYLWDNENNHRHLPSSLSSCCHETTCDQQRLLHMCL